MQDFELLLHFILNFNKTSRHGLFDSPSLLVSDMQELAHIISFQHGVASYIVPGDHDHHKCGRLDHMRFP